MMAKTKWKAYAPVDVRAGDDETVWPTPLPPMTAPEAVRAASKLWRFVFGVGCPRDIYVTSGNRYTGESRRGLEVNPDRGWRNFVHELSHAMWTRYAPTYRGHGTDHGRFESKLAREVIKRGWLGGTLKDKPKPEPTPAEALAAKHAAERKRIEARLAAWQRRERLAANGVARVERELAAHDRKVRAAAKRAAVPAEAKPAPKPRKGPWQLVRERAAAVGVQIERDGDGGHWVSHPSFADDESTDPLDGSHFCRGLGEVAEALRVYEEHFAQRVAA